MSLANIVLFLFCCQFVFCRDNYKASIIDVAKVNSNFKNYPSLIHEAAKLNADILVLPAQELSKSSSASREHCADNYDEIVKTVSNAAKAAQIYVVTHLYEEINCDFNKDLVRSTLVFDRKGDIIAVNKKPVAETKCNGTYSHTIVSFSTDFGVNFGVLMEEDILLQNINDLGLNNFIVLGASPHQLQTSVGHLASSWAFTTKSNVISMYGVYGNTNKYINTGNIIVGELNKNGNDQTHMTSSPSTVPACPGEDPSQYSIRALDLELTVEGYKETVCHGEICCEFYVKSNGDSRRSNITYVLMAHTAPLKVGSEAIDTQCCALAACKRSSSLSESDSLKIMFERVSISGNFTKNSAQFPILLTSTQLTVENFKFERKNTLKHTQINTEINNIDNLLKYGIFSSDYTNDIVSLDKHNTTDVLTEFSNYISDENVQEFFDYVWIRLRVVVFIVSIYILEMM